MGLTQNMNDLVKTKIPFYTLGEPVSVIVEHSEISTTMSNRQEAHSNLIESRTSATGQHDNQNALASDDRIVHLYPNTERLVAIDIMTELTALMASHPKHPPRVETHTVMRRTGEEHKQYPSFAPEDLYDTLARRVLDYSGATTCPPSIHTKLVLVFDKGQVVVQAKHSVQADRNSKQDLPPYEIPGMDADSVMNHAGTGLVGMDVCITDAGLDVGDGEGPQYVMSSRLMLSRSLRTMWYSYLRGKFVDDRRFRDIHLIIDYNENEVYEILRNGMVTRKDLALKIGEGEVGVVAWAYRHRHTHACQVRSGDSDIIPIALLHYHWFASPLMVVLHRKRKPYPAHPCESFNTINTRALACTLQARGWSVVGFVLGMVVNGTDFVKRSDYLSRVGKMSTNMAAMMFVHHDVGKSPATGHWELAWKLIDHLESLEHFDRLVRTVMTWHHTHGRKAIWGPGAPQPSDVLVPFSTQQLHTKRRSTVGHPTAEAIEKVHPHVLTNLRYWTSLQNMLGPKGSTMAGIDGDTDHTACKQSPSHRELRDTYDVPGRQHLGDLTNVSDSPGAHTGADTSLPEEKGDRTVAPDSAATDNSAAEWAMNAPLHELMSKAKFRFRKDNGKLLSELEQDRALHTPNKHPVAVDQAWPLSTQSTPSRPPPPPPPRGSCNGYKRGVKAKEHDRATVPSNVTQWGSAGSKRPLPSPSRTKWLPKEEWIRQKRQSRLSLVSSFSGGFDAFVNQGRGESTTPIAVNTAPVLTGGKTDWVPEWAQIV
jgi:hypothetical protein